MNIKYINVALNVNGESETVRLQEGAEVAEIRSNTELLEDLGAPTAYTFAVNGQGVSDDFIPQDGDVVTLRPLTSVKG